MSRDVHPDSPTAAKTSEVSRLSGQADSFGFDREEIVDLAVGTDLGGVTIVRLLAQGGMGRVYEGRQQSPSRPVAVKVLRDGLASRGMMKRFEQEAHLLARLRHPHIAQVHTLGTCRHGSVDVPFFVMELVAGALPIDQFIRAHGLSVRQRVMLLRRVAAAVAYGHRMGVVHRDLKPGNILVGSDGEPKVIDFGVARSTDADLALATIQNDAGQIVGTLRYMSPEQFDEDASRIDAWTDVHGLGLVMHELLTGDLPFDVRGKPLIVAARIIREQEPRALATVSRALATAPGVDRTEARQLAAVTEKCLQKLPGDRYATATELEAELARWLAGEPVLARPATVLERAVRWGRRHRWPVAAAAILCAAGLATVFSSIRASHQERMAAFHRAAEQEESYYSSLQRAAEAVGRRNIRVAASLLARARALGPVVIGQPVELDCLAASMDDSIAEVGGQTAILRTVAATPDGSGLIIGADDGTARLWAIDDEGTYREQRLLSGHTAPIWSAAFSPAGRWAATAAENGQAIVWDIASGKSVGELLGHTGAIYGIGFSPHGRLIATASGDGTVGLWDAESLTRRSVLTPGWRPGSRDRNVYGVAFAPLGNRLAAACGDGQIRLWDLATGEPLPELRGHTRRVFSVGFSPDGSRVASAAEDGTARIWNLDGSGRVKSLRHPLRVNGIAWSADGLRLATVSADAILRLWDPTDGRLDRELVGHRDAVWSVTRLSANRFATASSDTSCRVWQPDLRGEPVMECGSRDGGGVRGVACSSDGQLLATATADGGVRLWNLTTCTVVRELPELKTRVNGVDFSPSGDRLAAACHDGSVRVHRVADGVEQARLDGHTGPVYAAVFSPDGLRLATAGVEQAERVEPGSAVNALGSNVSQRTASREPGMVRIRTLAAQKAGAGLLLPHPARAHAAAWSPDGRRLATACSDGVLRIWETTGGHLLHTCTGHSAAVNWVAFARDGSRLATASSDGTVRLWNPQTGASLEELIGPVGQVWKVAFSPDGSRVAGVGADGCLYLWHAVTGRQLLTLDGHDGQAWGVAFAPDGRSIVTGSDNGTARLWGVSPAEIHQRRTALGME